MSVKSIDSKLNKFDCGMSDWDTWSLVTRMVLTFKIRQVVINPNSTFASATFFFVFETAQKKALWKAESATHVPLFHRVLVGPSNQLANNTTRSRFVLQCFNKNDGYTSPMCQGFVKWWCWCWCWWWWRWWWWLLFLIMVYDYYEDGCSFDSRCDTLIQFRPWK